jgi:hypothetical protein
MVSVLTSVIIAFFTFYFGIYYFLTMIGRGILWIASTPKQRAARKRSQLDRITDGLALCSHEQHAVVPFGFRRQVSACS